MRQHEPSNGMVFDFGQVLVMLPAQAALRDCFCGISFCHRLYSHRPSIQFAYCNICLRWYGPQLSALVEKRNMKRILLSAILFPAVCFGAYPHIDEDTEDTDTRGRGNMQFEINTDYSYSRIDGDGGRSRENQVNATLSYGLTDRLDIATTIPYQRSSDDASTQYGIGDMSMELKWRFYESGPVSLALKPQITLPTGDDEKGLGNGRNGYSMDAMASYEMRYLTISGNLGYAYADNKFGTRKNIWNASVAAEVDVASRIKLSLDVGSYRNDDPNSNTNPAFAIIGLTYSPTKSLDLDIGLKKGINKAEVDHSWGAGLAVSW